MGFAALFAVFLFSGEDDDDSGIDVATSDASGTESIEPAGDSSDPALDPTTTTLLDGFATPDVPVGVESDATSSTPTTTIPEELPEVSMAFVGDMMLGSNYPPIRLPGSDAVGVFDPVLGLLESDLTVGNLEGPITEASGQKCSPGSTNCFAFRMPLHYIDRFVAGGFDALNVANNHGNDMGYLGLDDTVRIVDEAGIAAYGQAGTVDRLEVNGVSISLIGFATYPIFNNLLEIETSRLLVEAEEEISDLVVVTFHGGDEGPDATHVRNEAEFLSGEPRGNLVEFSHTMVDAGADLVVGHGPHVLRGIELYNGRLIAYSLGNFATYGFTTSGPNGESGVLHVTLDSEGTYTGASFDSVLLTSEGFPQPDPTNQSLATIKQLSFEDFGLASAPIMDTGKILSIKEFIELSEAAE